MAKKRVIAHFMHEIEEAAALAALANAQQTESYVLGEIDEAKIAALRKKGLIVQVLEDVPEPETPGMDKEAAPGVRVHRRQHEPSSKAAEPTVDETGPAFYLIQLQGPLLEQWRKELDALKVRLLEYVPHNHYTARLTPRQLTGVQALTFVAAVRLYGSEDTGPASAKGIEEPPPADTGARMLTYDLRLHRARDLAKVRAWLEGQSVSIAGAAGRKIRLYLLEGSPLIDEVAGLPEVAAMELYVRPRLHNHVARVLLGIDREAQPNPGSNLTQTGDGQVVAVADTGLDSHHPDFQGRIAGIVPLGRPLDASDPHGHGTHVAGSVLGDGQASAGLLCGTAPGAKLFFQSLLDANGELGGLPLTLSALFEPAYRAGARIHNNSWGSATASMYTIDSTEVDEFVAKRRDMLIVISAGNEGQAAQRLNSQPGFVDWLSIGSPASSKNALTVGASRTNRTKEGYAALTYGQAWPAEFPEPPIASQNVSGDPEALAAFSSRGPCDDRRIKPDVVAPGTDIASAKSTLAPLRNFWGPYPGNPDYAFMGGTSMAAPLVAGCAALVREYYVKDRKHKPSAALLKATLINSTRQLTAADATADHPHLPNYHQGFGCVYMPWAIPNPSEPQWRLEFVDTWKQKAMQFARSGQRFRFQVTVAGGKWLRLCLAWTDLPARALQNNLNLFVQHVQSTTKWMGNEELPFSLKIPDPDNNVEVVRLENPQPGDYWIQISATNLLKAPQDFALLVTGELTTSLVQIL
jgi:serine protease AprX